MKSLNKKINSYFDDTFNLWISVFEDYDGAPDSNHPVGRASTIEESIEELKEKETEAASL